MRTLEEHYKDLCDIEFTIEHHKLWMLQTRVGKRTPAAAFRIAAQLVDERSIDLDEALRRVTGDQLAQLMFPRFHAPSDARPVATGMNASPGAAVGIAVFDCADAVRRAAAGERVILVRRETTPDDLEGMIAAEGILTSHGGRTSHAAVVARGMGKCCVCGAEDITVDAPGRKFRTSTGTVVSEGDLISVDGTSGKVYLDRIPVENPPVVDYFEGSVQPGRHEGGGTDSDEDDIVGPVHTLLQHGDRVRRLGVRANADTPRDAERARRFGAEGIGLCRTEHMFLGERRLLVERLVLAQDDATRDAVLTELGRLQRGDFEEILAAMDGSPVTVRLIDPPLHEFLPDLTELSVRVAVAEATGTAETQDRELLQAVRRLHEQNPMLGLRGVRLGIVVPGLVEMQVRALAEAAAALLRRGLDPRVEIMIPLVSAVQELEIVRQQCEHTLAAVEQETGVHVPAGIGTMIELPRAALTAGEIATAADFFSFGTNDPTQTAWGFSRDDVERSFFPRYLDAGVFGDSPFEVLDRSGVGRLVSVACREGREVREGLHLGVCGEHGGNPPSIHFTHAAGLDYVSCSPYRVPVARLEAGRAAVPEKAGELSADSR
nr:putative PEP-binding protein [Motilibacter deserti]